MIILKICFIFGLVSIGVLSLLPQEALPDTGVSDKLEHLAAYAILCLVGQYAFDGRVRRLAIGLILYGVLLEGLQSLVPGRYPSPADIVANSLGVGIGYLYFILKSRWRGKRF
jgi:VanZ family protein